MPHIIIIAGSNGAGKTTSAPVLLKDSLHINNFVNADTIAQGLCAFQPEKAAIQAGRIMLDRIHNLAREGISFAFETILASRSFASWIPNLRSKGYKFHLFYLWLKSANLAVSRVKERVKMGGHMVPEETVRRRYEAGIRNFFNLYTPLADSWQLFDNSDIHYPRLVASGSKDNKPFIKNEIIWQHLLEKYCERQM